MSKKNINSYSFITKVIKEQNTLLLKYIEEKEGLEENELINIFLKINYYSPTVLKKKSRVEESEKKLLLKKIKNLS